MNFQNLTKAEPNGIQVYLADESITSEAAADAATAGQTYMLKNGNILMDDTILNSYTYQGRWVANGGGSSGDKITDWIAGSLKEITPAELEGLTAVRSYSIVAKNLTKLELPNTVKTIEPRGVAYGSIVEFITGDGLETIQDNNFIKTSISKINIGSSLQDASCFCACGIKDIILSSQNQCLKLLDGVVYDSDITTFMFAKGNLTNVVIPSTVTTIPDYAFMDNKNIVSIIINGNIANIGKQLFWECSNLTSAQLNGNIQSIPYGCFYQCTSLTSITLPQSITEIGTTCFANCSSLETISLPQQLASIGGTAFASCIKLQSVNIPGTVATIDYGLFNECSSLSNVVINNGTTTIDNVAFQKCISLTQIEIPSTVSKLGTNSRYSKGVFDGCSGLKTIICRATTPPTIAATNNLGSGLSLEHIYVPSNLVSTYKRKLGWQEYSSIIEAIPEEV